MSSKLQIFSAILAFFIIVTVIYQDSYLDYARHDQIAFMTERNAFKSDRAWIMHGINYDRTRLSAPGDYLMFSPGRWLSITLSDLLRDHQALTGIWTIALHLMVVVLLYFTLMLNFKGLAAFPFAALLASQYAGIEMITWRYDSPFMISVFLVLISFLIMFSGLRWKYFLSSITLFGATLFHEIIPVSMILLAGILIPTLKFSNRDKIQKDTVTPKLIILLSIAVFLYIAFDIINWKLTHPPAFLGPADHFSLNWMFVKDATRNLFHYLGAGTRAVFNPFSVQLKWDKSLDDWAFFYWDITENNIKGYFLWAGFAVVLLLSAMSISLRRVFYRREKFAEITTLWACCGLIAFTTIYSIARLTWRDISYAKTSGAYYYWFFYFFYVIIVKFLLDEVFKKIPPVSIWGKWLRWILYIIIAVIVVAQGLKARDAIEKNYDLAWAKHIQQAIRTSEVYFTLNPDACLDPSERYLGVPPRNRQFFTLPYYLNKYNCGWVSGSRVVHLYRTDKGVTTIRNGPYPISAE